MRVRLKDFFSDKNKPRMKYAISAYLGPDVNPDIVIKALQNTTKHYSVGPFWNYMEGEEYKEEHDKSWASLAQRYQVRLYDKVLAALQSHLAPHRVRFHPMLNVTGWPFRIRTYDHLDDHPWLRKIQYIGAPPHRDALWRRLGYERMCKCQPSLWDPHSNHTISYTLALKIPSAGANLRVWMEPLDKLTSIQWAMPFFLHQRTYDDIKYHEGVMVIHSGQEYHAPGEDHVFETKLNEHRITLQGHGVFCDGEWVVF
eukprot:gnl/TRDRNA2_/TRDRNA2_150870_c0_seq1.p1 gnl/TRDRNA2_/TRDRNA2_150870_c0~~gnl/TRDRNA2_/TRDRNA2_150870_c0_seq1.p1  ORF type:complete len:256 (-),score=11.28 gnl/TRDRNA2_/TRDRNA2_150870_c0_seq1:157-924(-)